MFTLHLCRLVANPAHSFTRGRGAPSVCLTFAHPSTSRRYPPCPSFLLTHRRAFVASSTPRAPPLDSQPTSSVSPTPPSSPSPSPIHPTLLSRLLPSSLLPNTGGASSTSTSFLCFRKIIALARPERRRLLTAISLLLVSSTVSLSIPFTVGRLIDYFTSSNPVSSSPSCCTTGCQPASSLHIRDVIGSCNHVAAFFFFFHFTNLPDKRPISYKFVPIHR